MRPIRIDRCICSKVPFEDLKQAADQHDVSSLEELQTVCEFGINCRLCHPYVRRMLETGATVFHEILTDQAR